MLVLLVGLDLVGRGEWEEDWKLKIAARIAAEIEDGVEDCGFVCLKRDVVAVFVLRLRGGRGRGDVDVRRAA